ncbi:unnamed protein product [Withania somnifera]
MFNLSPYTLVSTTNFWFFISNTLILIIAVDFNFGSFSSSNDQEYLFQEYMKSCREKSNITISTSSFNYSPTYNTIEKKEIIKVPHEEVVMITKEDDEEEEVKDVVLVENNNQEEEVIDHKNEVDQEDDKKVKKSGEVKCTRSKSDLKAIIMVETNDEKKINNNGIIQRSKSERYDLVANEDHDEEINNDDLSEMSVEELNRRVEEFIQRFNRQIRQQKIYKHY